MAEINLTGNLGSDSVLTFTPNGKAKLEFSVGDTPRRMNQQTQQWEDAGETTWWRVTLWEEEAQEKAEQLLKGTKVYIIGTAGVRTYEKKDGGQGFSAEVKPKHVFVIPRKGAQAPRQPQSGGFGGQQQPAQGNWKQAPQNTQGWGNGPGAQTEAPF